MRNGFKFNVIYIFIIRNFSVYSQEDLLSVEKHNEEFSKTDRFLSGNVNNDDVDNGHVGDEDDYEEETIERNDAIFQKPVQAVSLLDSDDDWERVADSDYSFERSVSFHSEHLDHKSEDGDIYEDTVRRFFLHLL